MAEVFRVSPAAARVNARLTQDDVTKAMGISNTTLISWENGTYEPKVTQARKLAALYGIPLDNIFFGSEIQNK